MLLSKLSYSKIIYFFLYYLYSNIIQIIIGFYITLILILLMFYALNKVKYEKNTNFNLYYMTYNISSIISTIMNKSYAKKQTKFSKVIPIIHKIFILSSF